MDQDLCSTCRNNLCAKKVSIFSSLDDRDINNIVKLTGHRNYFKGDFLCHEGDLSSKLFIVNEGKVKLSKFNKDGKEQILRILSNGSFFGEFYLFSDNEPYNFSAIAISDVKICTLSKSDMDVLLKDHPDINQKILAEISRRLIQTENLVQNLSTNDTSSKVAYVLLKLSERYGRVVDDQIHVEIPINREEMANYAGVTRETMSRKLSSFEQSGIIRTKGHKMIIIINKRALMDLI